MMLESALDLAKKGFHIFPLIAGSKLPATARFQIVATRDEEQIKKWWKINPNFNIGISTTTFGDNEALIGVDVDNKGNTNGNESVFILEMEGKEFPPTYTQTTPSGGKHFIYRTKVPVKQGTHVLAKGIDIRSNGGYLVGASSVIGGKTYTGDDTEIAFSPDWIPIACGNVRAKEPISVVAVNENSAFRRATHYLENEAPFSIEGQGGDETAFKVAAKLKDFGLDKFLCFEAMAYHWNQNCVPPWDAIALKTKIENAYSYGQKPVGILSPEASFEKIETEELLDPVSELNKEYGFIILGGHSTILHETINHEGNQVTNYMGVHAFHDKLKAKKILFREKPESLSALWMGSPKRRSYDGLCFDPSGGNTAKYYNTWRGFTVEPGAIGSARSENSLKAFLEHAKDNICGGDESLNDWLLTFFAHMIQKPKEKPTVALVFKGKKGVGKNALIDRVGYLLGSHYVLTADKRYLVGNFNAHLQNTLLLTLDEAFWSGDKQAEGALKNLISGNKHHIEMKGKEAFSSLNCTRVCIIGNEDWLVPASDDERRYAVFTVGDGKKQNTKFFREMREGMEGGGYSLLLRFLQQYDISAFDLSRAPITQGLLEQKISSLSPFDQWWHECLTEGYLVSSDFGLSWQTTISKTRFRQAFQRYCQEHKMGAYGVGSAISLGRSFKKCVPGIKVGQQLDQDDKINTYLIPDLAKCREIWDEKMGQKSVWE